MINAFSSTRFSRLFIVAGLLGAGAVATTAVGCSSSSTTGGGGGTDAATDSPTADANNPTPDGSPDTDASDTDTGISDAGTIGTEFKVDGQTCTFANLTVTSPSGGSSFWTVTADLTCPVIGAASFFADGEDNKAYPQVCVLDSVDAAKEGYTVDLGVKSETDGGYNYATGFAGGSCSITGGPKAGAENAPIILSATVSNGQGGTTHTIVASVSARPM